MDASLLFATNIRPTVADPSHSKKRVLLVEDDLRVRRTLGKLLRIRGCEVVAVANGRRALETLAEDSGFELVLSDIDMPVLDGVGLARQVELCYPELNVVLMTGSRRADIDETALNREVAIITKPPTADQLTSVLAGPVTRPATATLAP